VTRARQAPWLEAARTAGLVTLGAVATRLAYPPQGLSGLGAVMLAPIVAFLLAVIAVSWLAGTAQTRGT